MKVKHSDRTFSIKGIENESDLVEVMTGHKWPFCQAFDYGGLLFLSDGDAEDNPEYVALKIDHLESTLAIGKEVCNIENGVNTGTTLVNSVGFRRIEPSVIWEI